ncbi:MAG: flavodoxin family protein [archaeon]
MKILAFNSSPRKKGGATDIILDKFLDGAKDAGADVEKIYLKDKKINQCTGCFTCWTKTPGVCVFKDDMPDILNKVKKADIIVFATPLYIFNMSAGMKTFIERMTMPLLDPHLVTLGNLTRHPRRFKDLHEKWVIISVCGFPEIEHFQGLDLCFEQTARSGEIEIAGKIYRPSSQMLINKSAQMPFKSYLGNCYLAGKEVVTNGRVSENTQKQLYKDFVIPKFLYRFIGNRFWDKEIKKCI